MTTNKVPGVYPSAILSTLIVLLLTALWATIRLVMFREVILPLTFVLPLLVCVWTRRRWQLWGMATAFAAMAIVRTIWLWPDSIATDWARGAFLAGTLLNILIGALVVQFIMLLRDRLERYNEKITGQNAELEAQAEELAQQNEEIKAQAEELAQQNEETESQAEELERQNEELQETSTRLANREGMLQAILESARTAGGAQQVLEQVCRGALSIIGPQAEALAVLELEGEQLRLRASARAETQPPLREHWPLENSLVRLVLKEQRTAYVDDLRERTDLAAPFTADGTVRSLLVTPLRVAGQQAGALAVCSPQPQHWTREQFQLIEWVAAQCGLILEGLHWQDELKQRAHEVEAANAAKDQFLAMLSHELRTPLTPVLVAASAFENDSRLPEDLREELAMIRRNAAVQSRLIDDLLDLTKIGQGKLQLHRQLLDIGLVLREAAAIVAGELDARDLTLTLDVDLPPDTAVEGDGARLQQVFWNLLKNAIRFSPTDGRIKLAARVVESSGRRVIRVEVQDAGVGIAAEDLERIFRPFEQAQASAGQGNRQGLGLGLSIARAIVELHGGSIRATSAGVGQGATLIVELPPTTRSAEPAGTVPRSDPRPAVEALSKALSPLRILLVEDHDDTARLLSRLLRNDGYVVEHAGDVAAAVSLSRRTHFDLIVSDLGLPDGSGLDLMRQIRSIYPKVPGICLSGYGMELDIQASRDAGFCEHLTKPLEVRQLQDAIGRVVKHVQGAAWGSL